MTSREGAIQHDCPNNSPMSANGGIIQRHCLSCENSIALLFGPAGGQLHATWEPENGPTKEKIPDSCAYGTLFNMTPEDALYSRDRARSLRDDSFKQDCPGHSRQEHRSNPQFCYLEQEKKVSGGEESEKRRPGVLMRPSMLTKQLAAQDAGVPGTVSEADWPIARKCQGLHRLQMKSKEIVVCRIVIRLTPTY